MKPAAAPGGEPRRDWHAMHGAEAVAQLGTDAAAGLADAEAAARLVRHGPNRLAAAAPRGAWRRFGAQFKEPLVLVLIAAGVVTVFLAEWADVAVIFGVVLVNAVVGFVQEGKATAALAALARVVATAATVLRGGRRLTMDAAQLVPGDIVWLAAGDKVPADLRLLHCKELRTAEAVLTGESLPLSKHSAALDAAAPLAERANMAYAGTYVVAGQGHGVVVATGAATATGHIAHLVASAQELDTPLTRKMALFAHQLLVAILALSALAFAVGLWRGASAFDMFLAAVALAVGAVPESLPAAVTVTLAIGVGRMARRHAIVRQLPAVETLGSTTTICADKTGTLTENAMTVRALWVGGTAHAVSGHGYDPAGSIGGETHAALREMLVAGVLCNDASLHHDGSQWQITGDPTEAALLVAARKGGDDEAVLRQRFPRADELPFDSTRQTMATLHAVDGRHVIYVKGALEKLLPACAQMLAADGTVVATDTAAIEAAAAAMASDGMRVLALARQVAPDGAALHADPLHTGLVFLGLAGMIDPPRAQAVSSIRACHTAGIQVKMITGDHAATALAVARQLGIGGSAVRAMSGYELATLDDAALRRAVAEVAVFARVEPAQKLRLVQALQANGEVVAMTGDGVNDAPALKQADIGIALGRGGTEVAKEAANLVLTDDNFATIEAAVEEGRAIYDNLVKFVTWTLPTNIGEGLVILAAILAGTTLPITPLQILWINMTTAVLLGLPLAFEPKEDDIMRRPPRRPTAPLLDAALLWRIGLVGVLMLVAVFGLFQFALARGDTLAQARTLAVNAFVMMEIFYLFNCRSATRAVWHLGWFSNSWVWAGVALTLALQLAFTYAPAMNAVFATAPMGPGDWLLATVAGLVCMGSVGVEKHRRRQAVGVGRRFG